MPLITARISLTPSQRKKAFSKKTFQLTADQLKKAGNDLVNFVSKTDYNRMIRNVKQNKGFRFNSDKVQFVAEDDDDEDVEGGSLKSILKSKVARAIGKKLVKIGATQARKNGLITKRQEKSVNILNDNLINNKNQDQSVDLINGLGFKQKARMIKGSQEAKDFMASLRAKRNGVHKKPTETEGEGFKEFIRNTKKGIKHGVRASKAIVWQPNVLASVVTGQPELMATAIGANAINYGLKHSTKSKKGVNQSQVLKTIKDGTKLYDDINQTQVGGYLVEGGSFALPKGGSIPKEGVSGNNAFFAQRDKMLKSGAKKVVGGSFLN